MKWQYTALLGVVSDAASMTLITNLVIGRNLHTLLFDAERKVQILFETKTQLAIQICQALVFMHSSEPPIIHLDLKPANVLVEDHTMHVFLADFGLSKMFSDSDMAGSTTMRCGTPGFQAPEQLEGRSISTKCDVYAFGGILTELCGELPLWPPHQIC
jgi:serine/threonine-protein kinase